jgi:hypothetical protein
MKSLYIMAAAVLGWSINVTAIAIVETEMPGPKPPSPTMNITTFYATDSGESRFREIEIPLAVERRDEFGHTLALSTPFASPTVQFVELPAGMDQDWHNAPARQIVVMLSGVIEVETTDGERRQWRAGDAFMPLDSRP